MFTGIVERKGKIADITDSPAPRGKETAGGRRLVVRAEPVESLPAWETPSVGESICVSGVCLTAVAASGDRLEFDVVPETLSLTTLGALGVGDPVNLEKSLAVGERFGGHFVTGHVDGTGEIVEKRPEGDQVLIRVAASRDLLRQMLRKGSITVEGVSLTLVEVDRVGGWFSFAAIPHTLAVTNLGDRQEGEAVNLETDAYGKWVLHGLAEILGVGSGGELNADELGERIARLLG